MEHRDRIISYDKIQCAVTLQGWMSQLGQAAPTPLLWAQLQARDSPCFQGCFGTAAAALEDTPPAGPPPAQPVPLLLARDCLRAQPLPCTALQLQPRGTCSAGTKFASHRQNASRVQTGSGTSRAAPVLTQGSAARSQSFFLSSIYLNSNHLIAAARAHIFGTYLAK